MVLDAPIQDDKKSGTKPGENVANEAIGKALPLAKDAARSATGNPGVDSLPVVPKFDQQRPSGQPRLKIGADLDEGDNKNKVKVVKGFDEESVQSLASGLATPDGAMSDQDRMKFIKMWSRSQKNKENEEITSAKAALNALGIDPKLIKTEEEIVVDGLNTAIKNVDANEILKNMPPAQVEELGAETIKRWCTQSRVSVATVPDDADGTITKSYRLTELTFDENGNDISRTKRMFQASFDKAGKKLEPEDFIARKLKDGKVSDLERALIESTLQAEYRDNTAKTSGFNFGAKFQSEFMNKIQNKLAALNPDLEIVARKSEKGSPTAYAYDLVEKGKITPIVDAELDLEHRDNDPELAQEWASRLIRDNQLSKSDLQALKSLLSGDGRRGIDSTSLINDRLKELASQGVPNQGSKPTTLTFDAVEDKNDGTTTITYKLLNGDSGKATKLFEINFDKKGNELDPAEFIASKLADGKITDDEKVLIKQAVNSALEENRISEQFVLASALRSKLMKEVGSLLKEMNEEKDQDTAPKLELLKEKSDVYKLRNLTSGETIDLELTSSEQKDPDVETAREYARSLATGSPSKDVLEKLELAITTACQQYGPEQAGEIRKLIDVQLKKLETPSDFILKDGKSAKTSSKTITYDLYNSKTPQKTIPRVVDIDISEESGNLPPGPPERV